MIKVDQELASIISAFHKIHPVTVHVEQAKEGFDPISMYFPPYTGFDDNDTNTSFVKVNTLSVKVFDLNNHEALSNARKIVDEITYHRKLLPIIDDLGKYNGDYMRLGRLEIREGNYNTAIIVVNWTSRSNYYREPTIPLKHIIMR